MPDIIGANELTAAEIDALFSDEIAQDTPPVKQEVEGQKSTEGTEQPVKQEEIKQTPEVDQTKAFAKRLKESTDKVRIEERNAIAKQLGYESYEDLQKKREADLLKDKELDPEQVMPVVDELVKKRLENDPRMIELAEFRKQRVKEFGERELAEITKLTGGEITSLAQLPKEVIDLWKTNGSLKAAFLELEGEKLINKVRSEQSKGSTAHLKTPTGSPSGDTEMRSLTPEEKLVWKQFNPNMTDEELNKITVKK